MTLEPYVIGSFGGLNLADDRQIVGASGATSIVNVDLDTRGRLKARAGMVQVKTFTATSVNGFAAFENTAGLKQFVVGYANGATNKYEAYGSAGGAAVATATPALTRISSARIGTTAAEYLYIGNGSDTIWRWDGAAFTQPAGMPAGQYLAVDANSNRLVTAVSALGGSAIQWSDPGLPETWTASNFVHFAPGDGSQITGLASWQNYVFAFKRRRFAVFTGESPDNDGLPIFNYNTVDGYGAIVPPAVGDEGVYFFDGNAVWVTQGGPPVRISRPIEAVFLGGVTVGGVAAADTASFTSASMFYSLGRLYLTLALSGGVRGVLVYDPKVQQWTTYGSDITFGVALRLSTTQQEATFVFGPMGGTEQVMRFDSSVGTDPTGDVAWSYTSGLYDVGPPERTAVVNDVSIVGSTQTLVTVVLATDRCTTTGTVNLSVSALLGDSEAWLGMDCEGRRWAYQLSGAGSTSITRMTQYVSFVKPAGIE